MSTRRYVAALLFCLVFVASPACEENTDSLNDAPSTEGLIGQDSEGLGLKGVYFNNKDFTDKVFERVDPIVNFEWGRGTPDSRLESDTFSVVWSGFLKAQHSETYTFYTVGDDGIRLYVDGELVVDDWSNHGARERSGTIALEAGDVYAIKLEYYENTGGAAAKLLWSSSSQSKQVIPAQSLFSKMPSDSPIITASGENAKYGEVKENAFDGDAKTKWLTFADSAWIQYDFEDATSKTITKYSITSANDAAERDPRDWKLLGSNDGVRFTIVDERRGETFSARFEKRTFAVQSPGSFEMYRLDISSNFDPARANSTQLAEIEFEEGHVATSTLCAQASEGKIAELTCPSEEVIASIDFASYGLPQGACDEGFEVGMCHALTSQVKAEAACLNKPSCTVAASNGVFGDPCPGKFKQIAIAYTCTGGGIEDLCPDDPDKTQPGKCGCGVPEGSCDACEPTLRGNERIDRGDFLCSSNGLYRFGLDDGGDLVLRSDTEVLWSAGLCCDAGFLAMQGSDGNLVVYTGDNKPRWASRTAGNPGAVLSVDDDGRAVIRIGSRELWSAGGVAQDLCPNDPNKTEPGECGCGVPEGSCDEPEPSGELKIVVFSVNSADASLIIFPTGKKMMVDSATAARFETIVFPFLERHGVDHLDYYVETHPHPDHVGGRALLESSGYVDGNTKQWDWETYDYEDQFELEGTEWFISNARDRNFHGTDTNYNSLSYRIDYEGFIYSASGDEGSSAQKRYLADHPNLVRAHLRNTAHHMWGPVTPEYLVAVDPYLFIISCTSAVREDTPFSRDFLGAVNTIKKKGGRLREYGITAEVGHVVIRASDADTWSYEFCPDIRTCKVPDLL